MGTTVKQLYYTPKLTNFASTLFTTFIFHFPMTKDQKKGKERHQKKCHRCRKSLLCLKPVMISDHAYKIFCCHQAYYRCNKETCGQPVWRTQFYSRKEYFAKHLDKYHVSATQEKNCITKDWSCTESHCDNALLDSSRKNCNNQFMSDDCQIVRPNISHI